MNHPNYHHQRGAALIIVLGLVALISTWAIDALYEDNIALRRAENSKNALLAAQANQSALILTAMILKEDFKTSPQTDDLDEVWAQPSQPFPIDDGMVQASIIDTNRFINLNNLVDNNGNVIPAVEIQVKRLFFLLDLDATLVDALIDWMDSNAQPHGSNGAEDSNYFDRDYHAKNARLNRWDELLLIQGFDAKIVSKLATVATIREVPQAGITMVNINTAPELVLMALAPNMTQSDAEIFMASRPYQVVPTAQSHIWLTPDILPYLSVSSDIFMVRTLASFGRANLRETFMLQRQSTIITLRSWEHSRRYR